MRWIPESAPCPICEGSARELIGQRGGVAHRLGLGVVTDVVRCRDCECFYTHPTLVPASNPYAEQTPDDYFRVHRFTKKVAAGQRLAQVAEALLGRKGTMLELGCGRGELLEGARQEGWDVFGIEMTPAYAAIAERSGICVERAAIEEARCLDGQYDVILFAAILEHLYQPLRALRRARSALAPGGLIFIDVPNEASLAMQLGNLYMRVRGRRWAVNLSPTFPPFHVVGFTRRSLERALEMAGFRIIRLTRPAWPNVLPSAGGLGQRIEHSGLTVASWFGKRLGMGDGICCWATTA